MHLTGFQSQDSSVHAWQVLTPIHRLLAGGEEGPRFQALPEPAPLPPLPRPTQPMSDAPAPAPMAEATADYQVSPTTKCLL